MKTTLQNEGVSGMVALLLLISAPFVAIVIAVLYFAVTNIHF